MSRTHESRAASRRRQRAPRRSRRTPVLVVTALIALGALIVWLWSQWRAGHVTLTFSAAAIAEGVTGTLPDLQLTIFPDRLSYETPSPPIALASVDLNGDLAATLDGSQVPGRAVVRYRGPDVGAGVVYVELGKPVPPIELERPRSIRGRVGEPIGFWCFGWRSSGMRPVADAEVIAMAGGEHGVALATARTDPDGNFVLTGVAASVRPLSVRVLAADHAITHVEVPAAGDEREVIAAVQSAPAVRGAISAPRDVDVQGLRILARGLPGVETSPGVDGSFVLEHIPPEFEPRLIVYGLGPFHSCREVRATRQGEVGLTVEPAGRVRGTVVDAFSGNLLVGAHVFAADGAATQTDADGAFELAHVLPGSIEITAQYEPPRRPRRKPDPMRLGRGRVELAAGQTLEGIRIQVSVR
ncbi:MAG: carboxypeptidase regulatory-like domain-containing protein [Planctomycetes bacterium]|nr:carboxypeptidase regulatory-like domain-containing protein [Planctomycetota bacterium]